MWVSTLTTNPITVLPTSAVALVPSMIDFLLVLAAVVSRVEAMKPGPAQRGVRAYRGSGRNAVREAYLRRNRSLQPALPLKMGEAGNNLAEVKLPSGHTEIELGFTSHVRASPL